jgi:hypothetical protein
MTTQERSHLAHPRLVRLRESAQADVKGKHIGPDYSPPSRAFRAVLTMGAIAMPIWAMGFLLIAVRGASRAMRKGPYLNVGASHERTLERLVGVWPSGARTGDHKSGRLSQRPSLTRHIWGTFSLPPLSWQRYLDTHR